MTETTGKAVPSVQARASGTPGEPRTPATAARRSTPAGHTAFRRGRASFLVHRRSAAVACVLALALGAAVVGSLAVGETVTSPVEVVKVLAGAPSPDRLVVGTLRLPRLVVGLLTGAALGAAGALIQTVARNPLASPEIIGVTHGASAVTVGALVVGVTDPAVLPYLSVAGGLSAALLVHLLAWRGSLHPGRFVLIGVGVSVALASLTQLFLTKGDQLAAQQAKVWITGSLNGRGWEQAGPLAAALAVTLPFVLWSARAQRELALDDDTATALGVRTGRARLVPAVTGVVLASVATGAAGPVGFVALLAPQLTRRLARSVQLPLLSSALLGALLVVLGDLAGRRVFAPTELPVGVVTAALGAPYLIRLIARPPGGGVRTGGRA